MTIYRKHNRTTSNGDRIKRMYQAADQAAEIARKRNSDRAILRQDDRASLDLVKEITAID
jgi:hypothetical protein